MCTNYIGVTVVFVAVDRKFIGIIGISDTIKSDARDTVLQLQNQNKEVWMLTGDDTITAISVARKVGIPESNVKAKMSPTTKSEFIEELLSKGKKVAMLGDGVNDAVALRSNIVII